MPETITLNALDLVGETLMMFLRKSDGTLLNTGGDAMTESGSTGVFTATLTEDRTGLGTLSVRVCVGSETADNLLYDGRLNPGPTIIDDPGYAVLDSAGQDMIAAFNAMRSGNVFTAPALANAPTGGGSGSGTGARTVTVTVNDGTTALQNATVRMTEGVNTYTALTNASGVAVFNLDDATYTVSISKSGYSYAGTTLLVNGTETATYSMTAIVITPGSDNLTTAWLVTRVAGVATAGITIRYQQAQEPDSDTGSSYDATIYNVDSDDDGVAEMPMVIGGYYYVWRGTGKRPDSAQLLEIPANAGATYELPSHVGR